MKTLLRVWSSFGASLFIFAVLPGCSSPEGSSNTKANTPTQASESSYCSQSSSYPSGIIVTGAADFQFRTLNVDSGLRGISSTTLPIPFAEIRITSSTGATIQCGTTDQNGALKSLSLGDLTVPSSGTYTISISSRSDTAKLKVTVNGDYYDNRPYELTKSISVTGPGPFSAGTMTASARASESPTLLAGAFNIYYQIYLANEFLRSTLSDSNFVAPKVKAYWRKGFNPYTYFGANSMLSFYRPGYQELFILGGTEGVVSSVDTDHFDNSVILHEYAHFLEDTMSISDSPGGSHDGNSIIDPRLAWSEGWANFFQAAVLRHHVGSTWQYYIDTKGYTDSAEGVTGGSLLVKVDLSKTGSPTTLCADSPYPFSSLLCDPVSLAGEGTFREMSISRYLFKTTDSSKGNISFDRLWLAFSSTDSSGIARGLASTQESFRNIGMFNKHLTYWTAQTTAWDDERAEERQLFTNQIYGNTLDLVAENTCSQISITGVVDSNDSSNQFRSNHFYRFNHNGQNKSLRLEYTNGAATASAHRDLDLHLYKEDYVYQEDGESSNGTLVRSSARRYGSGDAGSEQINLSGLAAGRYLLNVKVYTKNLTTSKLGTLQYRLKQLSTSTEDLCPTSP